MPLLMASDWPLSGSEVQRICSPYDARIACVPSVDAPSTTMISRSSIRWARHPSMQRRRKGAWLRVGITKETFMRRAFVASSGLVRRWADVAGIAAVDAALPLRHDAHQLGEGGDLSFLNADDRQELEQAD